MLPHGDGIPGQVVGLLNGFHRDAVTPRHREQCITLLHYMSLWPGRGRPLVVVPLVVGVVSGG